MYPPRLLTVEHFYGIHSPLPGIKIILAEPSYNNHEMQVVKMVSIISTSSRNHTRKYIFIFAHILWFRALSTPTFREYLQSLPIRKSNKNSRWSNQERYTWRVPDYSPGEPGTVLKLKFTFFE